MSESPPPAPVLSTPPAALPARRRGRPTNERFRVRFTQNLNRLLDQHPELPREPAARAAELARVCAVTPAAARKWLTGAGWPTLEKLIDLAQRYGFAPQDLLSDGSARVIDVSRLIDAQALRRAALTELMPVPAFPDANAPLELAIDPALISAARARDGELACAVVEVNDDLMAPVCCAGDRVLFQHQSTWNGDALYLLQPSTTAALALRSVKRHGSTWRISALAPGADVLDTAALAGNEAEALSGLPLLRGRALAVLRRLDAPGS